VRWALVAQSSRCMSAENMSRLTLHACGPRLGLRMTFPDFGITDGSARFRLGLIQRASPAWLRITDWPMAAALMLAVGWNGVALAELAGEGDRSDPISVRNLVDKATAEVGLRLPDNSEAVWCLTLIQCSLAANGTVTPKQAADTIIDLTIGSDEPAMRNLLFEFAQGFEWDDAVQYRPAIEARWLDTVTRYNDLYGKNIGTVILLATNATTP
jgi:hypothetical protein